MRLARRSTIAALTLALPLGLAACGSSNNDTAGAGTSSSSLPSSMPSSSSSSSSGDMAADPFGPACSAVPKDGKGSFAGMATDPVATAASNNPVLSQLVGAVKAAGLVDTLNSAKDITVFAPTNDAFAAVPKDTLDAAMKDPKGLLSKVLTNHVVQGRITPDQLEGDHKTLAGSTIMVSKTGDTYQVGQA